MSGITLTESGRLETNLHYAMVSLEYAKAASIMRYEADAPNIHLVAIDRIEQAIEYLNQSIQYHRDRIADLTKEAA